MSAEIGLSDPREIELLHLGGVGKHVYCVGFCRNIQRDPRERNGEEGATTSHACMRKSSKPRTTRNNECICTTPMELDPS
jgi:hypothetical protein